MIAAAIDIGTNSIKMAVGEASAGGRANFLLERAAITRLGESVDSSHSISPEAARRSIDAIGRLLEEARQQGGERVCVVATSALRDASNRDAFAAEVQKQLGVPVEILTGERECRLSFAAAALDPQLELGRWFAVVDSGGGSTEVALGQGAEMTLCTSTDIGAVRLHERSLRHDPPSALEMAEAIAAAEEAFACGFAPVEIDDCVAVGGSAVNVGRIIRRVPVERTRDVHGALIGADEVGEAIALLAGMRVEERKKLVGLDPERADIILAGAIILDRVLRALGCSRMIISIRGLRHGVLLEMLEGLS